VSNHNKEKSILSYVYINEAQKATDIPLLFFLLFSNFLMPTYKRRCSDPNLYSLKNMDCHPFTSTVFYLPPIAAVKNQQLIEKHQQFSDTSCQERSIMIDKLIDACADIIDSIWSQPPQRSVIVMSTSQFIREILKRSRATYSMLQLALFYIFRIKKLIVDCIQRKQPSLVCCGRRMFLASLMIASKYLNDKNYKNKTWAKIASLNVAEINAAELVFLRLIDYQLYVSKPLYDKWVFLLHDHIQKRSWISAIINHHPQYEEYPSRFDCPSTCSSSSGSSTASSSPNTASQSPYNDSPPPPLIYHRGIKKRSRSVTEDSNPKRLRSS
jgi:hypothetical protein